MDVDEALLRRDREMLRRVPDRVYRVIVGPAARIEDFYSDKASGRAVRVLTPETFLRHQGFSAWLVLESAVAVSARYGRYFGFCIAVVASPPGALFWPSRNDHKHVTAYGDPASFLLGVKEILLPSSVRLR